MHSGEESGLAVEQLHCAMATGLTPLVRLNMVTRHGHSLLKMCMLAVQVIMVVCTRRDTGQAEHACW